MTPEAQRIAIAEVCGWKLAEPPNSRVWWKNGEWVSNAYDLPDYLNDLNAMHEAEKVLGHEHWQAYSDRLRGLMADAYDEMPEPRPLWMHFPFWHATAAQRAEAFLKTLNLWRDES